MTGREKMAMMHAAVARPADTEPKDRAVTQLT